MWERAGSVDQVDFGPREVLDRGKRRNCPSDSPWHAAAAERYRRLPEVTPDSAQTHANLGVTRYYLGQVDAAVRSFERALSLEPDYCAIGSANRDDLKSSTSKSVNCGGIVAQTRFRIDPMVSDELVALFAEQLDNLEDRSVVIKILEGLYGGDKSSEYYEGLLAGYANAFNTVIQSGRKPGDELGQIVAFVASKVSDIRWRQS